MAILEAPVRPLTSAQRGPFRNEPAVDFTRPEIARQMRAALSRVHGQLGREYDLIIGGRRGRTNDKIRSLDPARPSEDGGVHQKAGKKHVDTGMEPALLAMQNRNRAAV